MLKSEAFYSHHNEFYKVTKANQSMFEIKKSEIFIFNCLENECKRH